MCQYLSLFYVHIPYHTFLYSFTISCRTIQLLTMLFLTLCHRTLGKKRPVGDRSKGPWHAAEKRLRPYGHRGDPDDERLPSVVGGLHPQPSAHRGECSRQHGRKATEGDVIDPGLPRQLRHPAGRNPGAERTTAKLLL